MNAPAALEIRRLAARDVFPLRELLCAIERYGDSFLFAPHPIDVAYLESLCVSERQDLHYVLGEGAAAIGYGLLRGWDEGYETPSLGIAIHPNHRGKGHGVLMMHFMHSAARLRGAQRVRLRVHPTNVAAIALYRRFGYRFERSEDSASLLVAFKELVA